MKKLSLNEMEKTEGGAIIDCFFMVAGFAGAVAASSTGIGMLFGALSYLGAVRSAVGCSDRRTWFYSIPSNPSRINTSNISGNNLVRGTGSGTRYSGPLVTLGR